jgi:hypothetical protein
LTVFVWQMMLAARRTARAYRFAQDVIVARSELHEPSTRTPDRSNG